MPALEINNFVLPDNTILVLPDFVEADDPVTPTGTVFRNSETTAVRLRGRTGSTTIIDGTRVVFVKEMGVKVKVDGVKYYAMRGHAVVGLIPP